MQKKFCIIPLLILFATILILQACSSMLMIGTAALVTTAWNDPRTIGTQLDDNILKTYITHALSQHQEMKQCTRIKNTVYQGNVLLTGQIPSIVLSNKAIQIVQDIYGTKNIYNAIRQTQPICFRSIIMDIWISNQIRLNFFIQNNIPYSNIKVITENKEVFLLGQVTYIEGQYAKKIANRINGVKNVFTFFIYI